MGLKRADVDKGSDPTKMHFILERSCNRDNYLLI